MLLFLVAIRGKQLKKCGTLQGGRTNCMEPLTDGNRGNIRGRCSNRDAHNQVKAMLQPRIDLIMLRVMFGVNAHSTLPPLCNSTTIYLKEQHLMSNNGVSFNQR